MNFVRQEGGNRVKEVIENIMIANSALRVVVCVAMLGSIIVRCDKAFVLQYTCSLNPTLQNLNKSSKI